MDGSGERAVVQEVVSFGSRRPNEARNLPRYCCVDICTTIRVGIGYGYKVVIHHRFVRSLLFLSSLLRADA